MFAQPRQEVCGKRHEAHAPGLCMLDPQDARGIRQRDDGVAVPFEDVLGDSFRIDLGYTPADPNTTLLPGGISLHVRFLERLGHSGLRCFTDEAGHFWVERDAAKLESTSLPGSVGIRSRPP